MITTNRRYQFRKFRYYSGFFHIYNTLGQYNLPPHTDNLYYARHREKLRDSFPDPNVQKSIDTDPNPIDFYDEQLGKLKWYLKQTAKAAVTSLFIALTVLMFLRAA